MQSRIYRVRTGKQALRQVVQCQFVDRVAHDEELLLVGCESNSLDRTGLANAFRVKETIFLGDIPHPAT